MSRPPIGREFPPIQTKLGKKSEERLRKERTKRAFDRLLGRKAPWRGYRRPLEERPYYQRRQGLTSRRQEAEQAARQRWREHQNELAERRRQNLQREKEEIRRQYHAENAKERRRFLEEEAERDQIDIRLLEEQFAKIEKIRAAENRRHEEEWIERRIARRPPPPDDPPYHAVLDNYNPRGPRIRNENNYHVVPGAADRRQVAQQVHQGSGDLRELLEARQVAPQAHRETGAIPKRRTQVAPQTRQEAGNPREQLEARQVAPQVHRETGAIPKHRTQVAPQAPRETLEPSPAFIRRREAAYKLVAQLNEERARKVHHQGQRDAGAIPRRVVIRSSECELLIEGVPSPQPAEFDGIYLDWQEGGEDDPTPPLVPQANRSHIDKHCDRRQ